MAGSYHHVMSEDHQYMGMSTIENMGDARECIEHLLGMIDWLAENLSAEEGLYTKDVWLERANVKGFETSKALTEEHRYS